MATAMVEGGRGVGRPKKPGGRGAMVRVDPDVELMAKRISFMSRETVGQIVSDAARATLVKRYEEFRKAFLEELQFEVAVPPEEPQAAARSSGRPQLSRAERDEEIRRLAAAGLSQRAIAEKFGVSPALVNRVVRERGKDASKGVEP